MTVNTFYEPGNLHLVDPDGKNERKLTAFNRDLLAEFACPQWSVSPSPAAMTRP